MFPWQLKQLVSDGQVEYRSATIEAKYGLGPHGAGKYVVGFKVTLLSEQWELVETETTSIEEATAWVDLQLAALSPVAEQQASLEPSAGAVVAPVQAATIGSEISRLCQVLNLYAVSEAERQERERVATALAADRRIVAANARSQKIFNVLAIPFVLALLIGGILLFLRFGLLWVLGGAVVAYVLFMLYRGVTSTRTYQIYKTEMEVSDALKDDYLRVLKRAQADIEIRRNL